jgi:hypothetical protein
MSRNTKITPVNKKPYCKVCFDAGKPDSEYTSHWVRSLPDRNGKSNVTCPTLLNTECRYCYKFGHTAKFCPTIKQQEKEREKAGRRAKATEVNKTKPTVQEKKSGSSFAALMDSDSEEEETPVKVSKVSKPVEDYPVLCSQVKKIEVELPKPQQETKTGWAAIVAKPAEAKKGVEPAKRTGLVMLSDYVKVEAKVEEKKPAPWVAKTPIITKRWADWSDSEDEEEEFEAPVWNRVNVEEEVDETW